jgi:hypothetical protein
VIGNLKKRVVGWKTSLRILFTVVLSIIFIGLDTW